MVECFVVPQSYRSFLPGIAEIPKTQFLQKIFVIFITNKPTMKHLLLLLFTTACFAQNAKVTAYRLIHPWSDGPCSIINYIYLDEELQEKGHTMLPSYATAESHDQKLINNLRAIKKQAKQWEKKSHICHEIVIPGDRIPNMFVIEEGSVRDTLFSYYDNDYIIFPDEYEAYHDKDSLLLNALTGTIRKLFNHDFQKNTYYWVGNKIDSISYQKVLYRGRSVFGMTEERLKNEFPEAVFIKSIPRSTSSGDYTEPIYRLGKDTLRFSEKRLLQDITAYDRDKWKIDGIAPGDKVRRFESKYKSSALLKVMISARFEDLERMYFCPLEFDNGGAEFYIKDGIITHVLISFNVR
jgi:hypothetical protein